MAYYNQTWTVPASDAVRAAGPGTKPGRSTDLPRGDRRLDYWVWVCHWSS